MSGETDVARGAGNPAGELIDPEVIAELRELGGEDEPGLVGELIELFLADAPARMLEIERALATSDLPLLERAAHTLKSSSANIGAAGLAELCRSIEELARRRTTEGIAELSGASRELYGRVEVALRNVAT